MRDDLNGRDDKVDVRVGGSQLLLEPRPLLSAEHVRLVVRKLAIIPRVDQDELDALTGGTQYIRRVAAMNRVSARRNGSSKKAYAPRRFQRGELAGSSKKRSSSLRASSLSLYSRPPLFMP